MKKLLRSLFCRHDLAFKRNIYGDEIIHSGKFKRSWWECKKCGAWVSKPFLHREAP